MHETIMDILYVSCLAPRFKNGRPREGLFINEKGFCVARAEVCCVTVGSFYVRVGSLLRNVGNTQKIENIYKYIYISDI